ncbi:MAG: hypothetical protein VZS44_08970 [Bacilli bacterium]|nr:hypothetical protein [Bacilli bacterium]
MKKTRRGRKSETKIEAEALKEEEISIFVIIGLTIFFITLGIVLGYLLFRLSIVGSL